MCRIRSDVSYSSRNLLNQTRSWAERFHRFPIYFLPKGLLIYLTPVSRQILTKRRRRGANVYTHKVRLALFVRENNTRARVLSTNEKFFFVKFAPVISKERKSKFHFLSLWKLEDGILYRVVNIYKVVCFVIQASIHWFMHREIAFFIKVLKIIWLNK